MLSETEGARIGRALTPEEQKRLLETAASNPEWAHVYCAAVLAANTLMRGVEVKHVRRKNLRHTVVTDLLEAGEPEHVIQAVTGRFPRRCWSTIRTSGSRRKVRCSRGWRYGGRRERPRNVYPAAFIELRPRKDQGALARLDLKAETSR